MECRIWQKNLTVLKNITDGGGIKGTDLSGVESVILKAKLTAHKHCALGDKINGGIEVMSEQF